MVGKDGFHYGCFKNDTACHAVRMRISNCTHGNMAQATSHAPCASNCACTGGLHFSAFHCRNDCCVIQRKCCTQGIPQYSLDACNLYVHMYIHVCELLYLTYMYVLMCVRIWNLNSFIFDSSRLHWKNFSILLLQVSLSLKFLGEYVQICAQLPQKQVTSFKKNFFGDCNIVVHIYMYHFLKASAQWLCNLIFMLL